MKQTSQKKAEQSYSEKELKRFAEKFAASLPKTQWVLFLEGGLGAGKTTLTRLIGEVLGVEKNIINSPTYPLVQRYELKDKTPLFHMDFYRLNQQEDLEFSGIEQLTDFNSRDSKKIIIEWSSKFPQWVLQYKKSLKSKSICFYTLDLKLHEANTSLRFVEVLEN